jgi:hypothetical protein
VLQGNGSGGRNSLGSPGGNAGGTGSRNGGYGGGNPKEASFGSSLFSGLVGENKFPRFLHGVVENPASHGRFGLNYPWGTYLWERNRREK